MKKITWFYLEDCPYCKNAKQALEELYAENNAYRNVEIDMINEETSPEIVEKYDYHAVPCLWIGQDKIYEAHLFEKYDETKAHVKEVLDKALAA